IAKFDELISTVKTATNALYKIIKQGSISDLDKQWSSISNKFKTIADESGKINLSKQKTDIKELMDMYQRYENAGGTNSLMSLTDNIETLRKLDKEYQKLNQTQSVDNSSTIEKESESFKSVEKSVDSLTTAIGDTKVQAINVEATAMEDAAEREIMAIKSILDNLDLVVSRLKDIKGIKLPKIEVKNIDVVEKAVESLENAGNKSNISSENQNKQLLEGEEIRKNLYQINSEIGLSEEEFIQKLRQENEEVKNGNRQFQERLALLKDGKVVASYFGDKASMNIHNSDLVDSFDKVIHSHSPIEGSSVPSFEDLDLIFGKYKSEIKDFVLFYNNEIRSLQAPGDMSLLGSEFRDYGKFLDAISSLTNNSSIYSNYANNYLASIAEEAGVAYKQIDALGNEINSQRINTSDWEIILETMRQLTNMHRSQNQDAEFSQIAERGKELSNTFIDSKNAAEQFKISVESLYDILIKLWKSVENDGGKTAFKQLREQLTSLSSDNIKDILYGDEMFYDADGDANELKQVAQKIYDNYYLPLINGAKELKSETNSPMKDAFQGDKIDQATTSAKELDKTLEQVDIPTDSFDDVLSKLDLTESKLKEIVKITKQSVSDSEGKFHDSYYTLKDKRGSTEIYGLSSNTEKGQLLRSNIVGYDAKEIEQEAKAVQKLAEEKRKLRQQEKQSTQSSVDKALKDQVSAWKQIQSIREKIAKSNDANEIENLKKVKKEYQQSYIEADKILKTNSDIYDKEAQIARLEQVRLETNKKIADYKNPDISSMESSLARFEESSEKLSLKPDNEHSFESWKLKIDELNNAINEYRNKITELQNKDGIIDKEDISEATELENRIKSLLREMQKTSSGDKGFEDISATKIAEQIHKLLEDNTAMSRKAKAEIQAYYDEVASGNPSRPLKEIYNDALKVVQAERAMGREGKSFLDTMKDKAWYGWAAQITSMFGVYDIINIFKQGANTLKEFDDGLTKISYTMDMTKSQLDNLGNSVLDMASNMKSSIDDAMQVAQIYANMQTSAEEIQKLSEPTLILSNLSGFDASTVADDIQAASQQFDIAAEDSMHIADVYDYISRNIQVDYSKGLESMAEGLQVAGSTAKQAGLDLEQTTAIIAKAVEKTRLEGSQVGNGLKTILTRISKVGELSDEVDNETLSKASESLHQIGIEVYNVDGSYRQFDVIMGELAEKWDGLTDAEKSNLSYNIAATRQTNLLSAILSNFSDSMQLAEEATNANGSAIENQQKYMESFSGHLQSLETEAKIAWLNILDSETLKDGVDLLTGLVKVVGQLVDTFGLLGTTAGIGGIVAGFKNVGRDKMYSLSFEYADHIHNLLWIHRFRVCYP
ncbi:phage tail tape measure protein, partial [Agathobacter sp.]|uniref:phage tail tape measure protein n=1 Tax=Agathobacter sp. TaxID=2021311 RepID=UPI002A916045